jgi:formylglycine-generating enzyme required for sulfatase activity
MRRLALLVALLGGCELAVSTSGLQGGCPHLPGPSMVKVTTPNGSYCIDSTEVTNAQYADLIASGFTLTNPPADYPPGCQPGSPTTPPEDWPPVAGLDSFPVVQLTWCQAYTYCAWAGKRLCGAIGGGPLAQGIDDGNPQISQWLFACSNAGTLTYPYGNTYSATTCGGQDAASHIAQVTFYPQCVGGFAGIYEMSGNVWEWIDSCGTNSNPTQAFCRTYGGAFDSTQTELTCASERNWVITSGAANIGFRCCADL